MILFYNLSTITNTQIVVLCVVTSVLLTFFVEKRPLTNNDIAPSNERISIPEPFSSSSSSLPSFIFVQGLTQSERNQRSRITLNSRSRRRHLFHSTIQSHYQTYLGGDDDASATDDGTSNDDGSSYINARNNKECFYYNKAKKKNEHTIDASEGTPLTMAHWTIEYCPQKSIRMMNLVHFQKNDDTAAHDTIATTSTSSSFITIESQPYIVNEIHSLGYYLDESSLPKEKFDHEIYNIWGNSNGNIKSNNHTVANLNTNTSYYIRGDECESLSSSFKMRRATKVHTQIQKECPTPYDFKAISSSTNFFTNQTKYTLDGNIMIVTDVMETSRCRYSIFICHSQIDRNNTIASSTIDTNNNDDNVDNVNNEEDSTATTIKSPPDHNDVEDTEDIKDANQEIPNIFDHFTHLPDNDNDFDEQLIENQYSSPYHYLQSTSSKAFPPIPPSRIESNKILLQNMFYHAYDSYMYNAYPSSELKPKSCTGGKFNLVRLPALTLIDTLDTLLIMGNYTEFARSVERLRALDIQMKNNPIWANSNERGGLFAVNQNVSVFETNIRVLGGLLSAHQMAEAYVDSKKVLRDNVFSKSEDGGVLIGEVLVNNNAVDVDSGISGDLIQNVEGRGGGGAQVVNECTEEVLSSTEVGTEAGREDGDRSRGDNEPTCSTSSSRTQQEETTTKNNTATTAANYWQYDGVLLSLAYDIGRRLLPAFDTKTGIPYGTVNLLYGIPHEETQVASLAGAGSLSIEMELLSRLSGDQSFGKAAKLATRALWMRRSKEKKLLGKHINIEYGHWTETLSGVGSNSDSFYEYLLKHYILYPEDKDFFDMFRNTYEGIFHNARQGDWYPNVDMGDGFSLQSNIFESLAAFFPGMQVLLGELTPAARSENSFISVRENLGFLPERFDFSTWAVLRDHSHHPLRPEIHESCYFLHMATKDVKVNGIGQTTYDSASSWLWSADFAIHELEKITKTKCGYGVVDSVSAQSATASLKNGRLDGNILQDEMPSFFLSETLKYFYLAFDTNNMINTDKERNWIFTTEAHPIHHVPLVKLFDSRKEAQNFKHSKNDAVRSKIINKLKMRTAKSNGKKATIMFSDDITLSPKASMNTQDETWARLTSQYEYKREMKQLKIKSSTSGLSMHLFGRVIKGNETSDINFATIEHEENGRGSHLSKSCPNIHHPNALWLHALTADQISYTDLFSSRFDDAEVGQGEERGISALVSSALLGLSYEENTKDVCSLYERNKLINEGAHSQSKKSAPPHGSQRVDMGQLGLFDISVYNGEGFFIKHVRSGESIEATIIDQQDSQEPFIAIEAYVPAKVSKRKTKGLLLKSLGSSFSMLRSVFVRKREIMMYPSKVQDKFDHLVLVSDLNGRAYSCSVDIIQASGPAKEKSGDLSGDHHVTYRNKKIVDSFPCLPATYGPTALNMLNKSEGQTYEATLHAPDQTDPFGCETVEHSDDINIEGQTRIDLVERGLCNFRSKAINLRARNNAEAVIIINTDGGKLFVMAGPEEDGVDYTDEPASILVTKEDGDEIIRIMNEKKPNHDKKTQIQARINILAQPQSIDPSNPVWPHVATEADSIQVLASQGWGVTAKKENGRWSIYILQHDGGNKTS